ncbi:MAG: hypothetical protein ACKOJB_01685 [Chthoniobacterales bacterium]
MVLVFSGHTNTSRHVNNEIERAVSHRITILPFRIERNAQPQVVRHSAGRPVDRARGIAQRETECHRAGQIAEDHEQAVACRLHRERAVTEFFDHGADAPEEFLHEHLEQLVIQPAVAFGIGAKQRTQGDRTRRHAFGQGRKSLRRDIEFLCAQENRTTEKQGRQSSERRFACQGLFLFAENPRAFADQGRELLRLALGQSGNESIMRLTETEMKFRARRTDSRCFAQLGGIAQIIKDNRARGCGNVFFREAARAQSGHIEPLFDFLACQTGSLGCLQRLTAHGLQRTPLAAQHGSRAPICFGRFGHLRAEKMRLAPRCFEPRVGGFSGQRWAGLQNLGRQRPRLVAQPGPCAHRGRVDAEIIGLRAVCFLLGGQKSLPRLAVSGPINIARLLKVPRRFFRIFGAQSARFG